MDIQDYTPSVGRQLRIKSGAALVYGLTLLGLGIFMPVRYNFYSSKDDYHQCQFWELKTITYITTGGNIFFGLILVFGSSIQLAAIRDWALGVISSREYWYDFHREFHSMLSLILFILQLGVFGLMSSNIFRVFNPSGCDPYLYYTLLVIVYIIYNILLICLGLYITGYLAINILVGLYKIIHDICQSCCADDFMRVMGNFGLANRGRVRRQRQILPIADPIIPPRITITTAENQLTIPRIIPKLVEFGVAEDCVVCIEPQKTGVGFTHCSHWVCEVCWSQIMNINPVCPLCRAQII